MKIWFKSEKGAAATEFAVIFPIAFLLLMGIVEFGRVMSVHHVVSNAAREGARIAALPGSNNTMVIERINQQLTGSGLPTGTITTTPTDITSANRNDPVTISVSLTYESIALMAGFIPGFPGTHIQKSVVMRKEGFG